MARQAGDEANKPWMVRDVPDHTRRAVKVYAAEHDMTIAQALEAIVDGVKERPIETSAQYQFLLDLFLAMHESLMKGDIDRAYALANEIQEERDKRRVAVQEASAKRQAAPSPGSAALHERAHEMRQERRATWLQEWVGNDRETTGEAVEKDAEESRTRGD